MADKDNSVGAPTEGLSGTPTFSPNAPRGGNSAPALQYVPTAPAALIPNLHAERGVPGRVDTTPSPMIQGLIAVASRVADKAYPDAQAKLYAKGQQEAAAGKAIEDVRREQPWYMKLFGDADAVKGAQTYTAQSVAQKALMELDAGFEEDATQSDEKVRDKYVAKMQGLSTGDANADSMARDLFSKELPRRFERVQKARIAYTQAQASAAQREAMGTGLTSLQAMLTQVASEAHMGITESDKVQAAASVYNTWQGLAAPQGQNKQAWQKNVADTLKQAAQRGELHAAHAMLQMGVLQHLPADEAEGVQIAIDKAENKAAQRFNEENKDFWAKLQSFQGDDGVSTEERLAVWKEYDRRFRAATGSSKGAHTAEQYIAFAERSEAKILQAKQRADDMKLRNVELRIRAEANRLQREDTNNNTRIRNEERADQAQAKLDARLATGAALTLAVEDPSTIPTMLSQGKFTKPELMNAIGEEVADRRKNPETAATVPALLRQTFEASHIVEESEARRIRMTPQALISNPEYVKDKENWAAIERTVKAYSDAAGTLGEPAREAYYGDTARFMANVSQAIGRGESVPGAVALAREAEAKHRSPEGKRADVKDITKALESGRKGMLWSSRVAAMHPSSAAALAEFMAQDPGIANSADPGARALDRLESQNLMDLRSQRYEQAGAYGWVLPPGTPSLLSFIKPGTGTDRIADVVEKAIDDALYSGPQALIPRGLVLRKEARDVRVHLLPGEDPSLIITADVEGSAPRTTMVRLADMQDRAGAAAAAAAEASRARADAALRGVSRKDRAEISRKANSN